MFDWKLYIAVILFILLLFINKHEPFIVSDDITDNVLLDTNGKTVGDNANTNSIKKNNKMVSQINVYNIQNDNVLNSINECMSGETILQKHLDTAHINLNLLTNPNKSIVSKSTNDQSKKITALIELLQRLQTSIYRTNDAIHKNNYNINSSLRTTFTNFRAGWFNGFNHGALNNDSGSGGWGMADNCVRDRMTRTYMNETYDKGFTRPGYNGKCFNISGRNLYNSLYNKYNNNNELTRIALQKPQNEINFITFLENFIDVNNWNGNPGIPDDSGWWGGWGLQGNSTPPKTFSFNQPYGIATIDPNVSNVISLNMIFGDKKITFSANGEHIIQGL